jgi:hypothetical protein
MTRIIVRSLHAYRAITGCRDVTPGRLFRFLGVKRSNVESVTVERDRIVVELYRPVPA